LKAVFDVKPESGYDDDITSRYHFPAKRDYMEAAVASLGDWIVYREPRRNGCREAYIGVARLISVEPDPRDASHAYAHVNNYLGFPTLVPLKLGGKYLEAPLRNL
jgi:putative restriction endonuclease